MIAPANYTSPRSCRIYTPRKLADALVNACGVSSSATWLEPSFGEGVFLQALNESGVKKRQIYAIDLATETHRNDDLAVTTRGVDFLHWAQADGRRFDRVIGNPPYVPFDELSAEALALAKSITFGHSGLSLNGRANLWAAFVAAAESKLSTGGSLAFILPAAWDYADYSAQLRTWLPTRFRHFWILRCATPLFDSVEEGAVVLLGRGYNQPHAFTKRIETRTIDETISALELLWRTERMVPTVTQTADAPRRDDERQLKEFLEIKIGAVTGDTDFFVLSESKRKKFALPKSACIPVLSRAAHIRVPTVTRKHWLELHSADERVWMFRPSTSAERQVRVSRYLARRVTEGGCHRERGKIKDRNPWYQTPLPPIPHGFISGMVEGGPWLSINRMRGLSATNTLYTVRFKPRIAANERVLIALSLLSTAVRSQVENKIRRYPGGLCKLEPGDLSELRLPRIPHGISYGRAEEAHSKALRLMNDGKDLAARAIADEILL